MRRTKTRRINVFKAILQSVQHTKKAWKPLLLFSVTYILLYLVLNYGLWSIGFMSFSGGYYISKSILIILKLLFIIFIIKIISNAIKGESNQPKKVIRFVFFKIGLILFQVMICCAVMVPSALIILLILMGITESTKEPLMITYIIVGITFVKIIFALHGVIINNDDSMESIKASVSLTRGNFIIMVLVLGGLWLLDYGVMYVVGNSISNTFLLSIAYNVTKSCLLIIQVSVLTSMYHQLIHNKMVKKSEVSEIL